MNDLGDPTCNSTTINWKPGKVILYCVKCQSVGYFYDATLDFAAGTYLLVAQNLWPSEKFYVHSNIIVESFKRLHQAAR